MALLLRPASSLARLGGRQFDISRGTDDAELQGFVDRVQPQALIHTACTYGRQGETLLQLTDTNLRLGLGLLQALQALPQLEVPRLFLNTGTALSAEVSPYALSKRQFAQWGRQQALAAPQRLRFVNIELEHMYGPGDDASKFATHVLHACCRHEPALKLTAGEQRRDFIYIEDVVAGFATLLERSVELGSAAHVPLGSGVAPTVREFVQTVHRLCCSRTELQFGALPYRAGEAMHCQADLGLMQRLGWTPRWSLEQGLQHTINLEFPQT